MRARQQRSGAPELSINWIQQLELAAQAFFHLSPPILESTLEVVASASLVQQRKRQQSACLVAWDTNTLSFYVPVLFLV